MRRLYYIPFVLVFLMQAGCTLSMEEYIVPEEDRGQGELYTQQEEFGTISYQFKDSVLSVTDNIQEKYLVRVESDSILYFSDQIPQQWRPYVGMKLASHITHALPWGLNHKVIAVENLGGILKVTATKVSSDEIYEDLKIYLDAPVGTPDLSGLTEEELKDYGYELMIDPETGDSVIMDWNDYDVARGVRPAGAKRKSLKRYLARTRGDDDEEEKEGEEKKDWDDESDEMLKKGFSTTVLVDQFWDTRDLDGLEQLEGHMGMAWKGIAEQIKASADAAKYNMKDKFSADVNPYIGVGISYTKYEKVHIEHDKKTKYEYKYTESWSDVTVKAEAGVSASASFRRNQNTKATYGNADDMLAQMRELSRAGSLPKMMGNNGLKTSVSRSWDHIKIRFPLGVVCGVPVAAILGAQVTPVVEINGSLAVSITYTTDRVRSIHKVENGKTEDFEEVIEEGHVSGGEAVGNASIKVGAAARAFAGIEVGATVGVTIGFNFEAYVEGEVSINLMSVDTSLGTKGLQFGGISGSIGWKAFAYFDVQLFVAPLGIDIWKKQLWKSDNIFMKGDGYNLNIGPNVSNSTSGVAFGYLMGDDVDDESGYVTATVWTGDMDVKKDVLMGKNKYYPGMKIYFGPVKDDNWTYMYPQHSQIGDGTNYGFETLPDMGDWPTAEANKSYSFVWSGNLKEVAKEYKKDKIDEVHMIPIFYCYKDGYDPSNDFPWEAAEWIDPDNMIVVDEKPTWQYVADPYIYTALTGQVSYKDMGMCEQGSVLGQGDNTWVMAKNIYRYSFYVTVDVMGGNRMKGWGLDLKMYDPWKKRYKSSHKKFKVDTKRSGRYTFLFTVDTDWQANKSLIGEKGEEVINQIYYTVVPYWDDPHASNALMYADDKESNAKHPIVSDSKKFLQDDKDWLKYIAKHPETYGKDLEFFTITEAY